MEEEKNNFKSVEKSIPPTQTKINEFLNRRTIATSVVVLVVLFF